MASSVFALCLALLPLSAADEDSVKPQIAQSKPETPRQAVHAMAERVRLIIAKAEGTYNGPIPKETVVAHGTAANGPLLELIVAPNAEVMAVGAALQRLQVINGDRSIVITLMMLTDSRPSIRLSAVSVLNDFRFSVPEGIRKPDRLPFAIWRVQEVFSDLEAVNDMGRWRELQVRSFRWLIDNRPDVLADQLPGTGKAGGSERDQH